MSASKESPPGISQFPVTTDRRAKATAVENPLELLCKPLYQSVLAGVAVAKSRATIRISSAGIPVISAAHSGLHLSTSSEKSCQAGLHEMPFTVIAPGRGGFSSGGSHGSAGGFFSLSA